ncbi:MAG: sigma-70 family RNA polymerase sigma factor [Oscillospiraceae bacterium]|nr:sigma-70 family RNA polymerase sigma factor [Oscillospiraceae bacterium]
MEDREIIALFWQRKEEALDCVERKYGAELHSFAASFLDSDPDGAECVNDAYFRAWNTIPPKEPASLKAYLYKLLRSACTDCFRRDRAQKRGGSGYRASLEELEGVVSGGTEPEKALDLKLLGASVEDFLRKQSPEKRQIFLRRYYFADPLEEIAADYGCSLSRVKSLLHRLRMGLKEHLRKEELL